jgi:hypothetical protein
MNHKIIKAYREMKDNKDLNRQEIVELYTTEILCELLNVLSELKKADKESHTSLDCTLEISNNGYIKRSDFFLSAHIAETREQLVTAVDKNLTEQDIDNFKQLNKSADRKFMTKLYNALYNHFKQNVAQEEFEDPNSYIAHRYLKMLLEAKVNGIYTKTLVLEK